RRHTRYTALSRGLGDVYKRQLLIYENGILYDGTVYDYIERDLYDENITLAGAGDEATVAYDFAINPAWNIDNIRVVAFVQQTATKEIVQGLMMGADDFRFDLARPIASLPDGDGMAVFTGILKNTGEATDTFTLEPGAPFGDWTTDFLVCGDPNPHSGPFDVVLDPEESCDVRIRVHTDAAMEARSGSFQVTSAFSARTCEREMRVFNGSYAVLFVDDDRGRSDEVPWIQALDQLGVLHDDWNVMTQGYSPWMGQILGYDYMLWETGFDFLDNTILLASDEATIRSFLDAGGSVFVSSQHYVDTKTEVTPFMRDYFGIASFVEEVDYTTMNGVPGDPIGDGLSLHLTFSIPSFNEGDQVQPAPGAATCFRDPSNRSTTLRNQVVDGGKCVFMAAAFHAVDNNPYPNNMRGALERIMDWLEPQPSAGAEDQAGAPLFGSRIDAAQPNPFHPRTQISFTLSQAGASGPVRLEVFDLSGRRVASLFEGTLPAGEHVQTWTGMADNGAPVESGVYFARLTTDQGRASQKLILLK
ncbi:MAG: T9SS type A sorting domain-containing protein, partial [Candidatus Eisenbacteria bacterium]|nr:T9SS type A sorting domain-containing protein [Candidatus Eisenbacteria bacterium]